MTRDPGWLRFAFIHIEEKSTLWFRDYVFGIVMLSLPMTVQGANIYVSITTTIPMQDFYDAFIICNGVQASSCNQNALFPLVIIENNGSVPAFPAGTLRRFQGINLDPTLWSGYIGYLALPQGNSSDVVVALRNGFVTAGSPWPFSTPENQIAADLLGRTQAEQTDLLNFFLSNLTDFTSIGTVDAQTGTFWEFSNGVNIGSLQTDAPELFDHGARRARIGSLGASWAAEKRVQSDEPSMSWRALADHQKLYATRPIFQSQ